MRPGCAAANFALAELAELRIGGSRIAFSPGLERALAAVFLGGDDAAALVQIMCPLADDFGMSSGGCSELESVVSLAVPQRFDLDGNDRKPPHIWPPPQHVRPFFLSLLVRVKPADADHFICSRCGAEGRSL